MGKNPAGEMILSFFRGIFLLTESAISLTGQEEKITNKLFKNDKLKNAVRYLLK